MDKKRNRIVGTNKDVNRVILMIDVSEDYRRGLLRGIANYCNNNRTWEIHIEQTLPVSKLFELAKSWGANGLITNSTHMENNSVAVDTSYTQDLGKLSSLLNMPIIAMTPPTQNYKQIGTIYPDNGYVGAIAAEYYMDKGFKSYAFCGYKNIRWSRKRFEGYLEILQTKSYTASIYEQNVAGALKKRREEILRIAEWLKQLTLPVAMFVCHDKLAVYVAEACKLINLKVPHDISILGVDNDEVKCGLFNPSLSSIAMNTERAGYEAAELLEKLMTRQKVKSNSILVRPKYVVERQSTNILQIDDQDVASALKYIRQNSNKILQIDDVLKSVSISRQSLISKFNRIVGHTVHDEIRKCHSKYIAQLLIETEMPIYKIAQYIGYTSERNISRFFHKVMGFTPKEYRKKFGRK